jgi:hypothetical protein
LKWRLLLLMAGSASLWAVLTVAYCASAEWANAARAKGTDEVVSQEVVSQNTIEMTPYWSGIAALLCLLPTAATLLWCDLVLEGSPEQQLAAVFGGTAIRMAFVVAAGMVLYFNFDNYHKTGFWLWVIVMYLATLALEMVLVVRRQAALDKKSGEAA